VKRRSEDKVERIKTEAIHLFGDPDGRLDLEALANARRTAREEIYLTTLLDWADGGGTVLNLGDEQVNLRAANVAIELALVVVVERVRAKHLKRVEQEDNAALRRRFGLPPE
jgi:hypothetical protein